MATKERPRAMVLVNAVSSTLTAFSQGEFVVCARTGPARTSTRPRTIRDVRNDGFERHLRRYRFTFGFFLSIKFLGLPAREGVPVACPSKGKNNVGERAVRAGSWTSVQAHLEQLLRDSVVPQSRPSYRRRYARQRKLVEEEWLARLAGVTGGNSPHTTNPSAESKRDRRQKNIFPLRRDPLRECETRSSGNNSSCLGSCKALVVAILRNRSITLWILRFIAIAVWPLCRANSA